MTRHNRGGVRAVMAVILLLLGTSSARAERYALLVGVSHYAASTSGALDLEGPAYDVPALRRVLVEKQRFQEQHVIALMDQAATRTAILQSLSELVARMRDGDDLLFYFSGHGTSAFDEKMRPLGAFIGPNSGALAPYDLHLDSAEAAAGSLIIGRRDLRPILERIPRGAEAVVILDACYSENSVRSIRQRLSGRTRGITVSSLLPRTTPQVGTPLDDAALSAAAEVERQYPYPNVFALTAASKSEQASDIDSHLAVDGKYPTFDGRPHGAFTNSLLEGLSGGADGNNDGRLTVQELHEFSRRSVQSRFSQTPQLLMPGAADRVGPLFETMSGRARSCQVAAAPLSAPSVRVRLDGLDSASNARIKALPNLQVVAQSPDLSVAGSPGGGTDLYDVSGSLIRQFRATELDALVARVSAQPLVTRFLTARAECNAFTASLRLRPDGQAQFSPRDQIRIEASVERDAYLVLFNIDKTGTASVVYPATAAERGLRAAGRALPLAVARAAEPYGAEHLKLVVFRQAPALESLGCRIDPAGTPICRELQPGSPAFATALALLERSDSAAESHVRFTTYEE